MKRTTKNLMTTLCCTALLVAAGCSSTGELSVTGMYGTQGQALSGDRCDELLMDAADADTAADQEEAQRDYRECVEDALEEDGRDGECREDDDDTCDVILDEVGDALDHLRGEGDEAPECDAPSSNSEEAVCHLMAAYEACELDRDNDGNPDVEDRPDGDGDDGAADRPDEPGDNDESDGEGDGDRPDDNAECQEVREHAESVGEEDAAHIRDNNPDCFDGGSDNPDEAGEEPADGGDEGAEEPAGGEANEEPADGGGDGDAFCEELEREIDECTNPDEEAELEEIHERECTP